MSAFTAMTELERYESELDLDVGTIAGKYYLVKFWAKLVKFFNSELITDEQTASFFGLLNIDWSRRLSSEESVELVIRNNFAPQHVCDMLKRFCPTIYLELLADKTKTHPFPTENDDEDEEEDETISFGPSIDEVLDQHELSAEDRAILKEVGLSTENIPFLGFSDLRELSIKPMHKRRLCADLIGLVTDAPYLDVWEL